MYNIKMKYEMRILPAERQQLPGVITVMFTLLSVIYLGLIGMLIESARIQGARAQSANITDMANMSLFGEFEQKLFEDYVVLAVDGAAGTGEFSMERTADRLKTYMSDNADPRGTAGLQALCFDPWMIRVKDCKITEYTLLTDSGGEPFYQQAVAYMRQTALMQAGSRLMDYYEAAQEADRHRTTYEQAAEGADTALDKLEKSEKEKKQELMEVQEEDSEAANTLAELKKIKNPLPVLRKLKRTDILKLVCQNAQISSGSVRNKDLSSKRKKKAGTWKQKKLYSGLVNNLLFREYLLDHFSYWGSEVAESGPLKYGLEYIIAGKKSDRANLKSVVRRLLLLREGCNYAYSVSDTQMEQTTGTMAGLLIGWTGIPELVSIMKHALLLGWSYGESLLDVRTLMMGGKVPLAKSAGDWQLKLSDLASLDQLLQKGRTDQSKGLGYRGYLRVLLNLQSIRPQKARGLDLAELAVKAAPGLSLFRADYCITAVRDESTFTIRPHYSRISAAMLGVSGSGMEVTVRGGYSYLVGEK